MESVISSDEDTVGLKNQLSDFGLEEENLSKEEMRELLRALNYSKKTVEEDELLRQKTEDTSTSTISPKVNMKRRYINVRDRRLPWSLLPTDITPAEKARTLAVYIKLMSIDNYRQARQRTNLAAWPPPIEIIETTTKSHPVRSTRSGRSVPIYADFDEDSSDFDCIVTKTKKRKVSSSDDKDATYSGKVLSLKRKTSKDENIRPIKEPKLTSDSVKSKSDSGNKPLTDKQIDLCLLIED
ncbi:uncharacterized protein LOC121737216 [Aricia agestis]|uniref:uncharacterized protein LOC121737216 n=1 Tax=Aricia agestis TaxID=91739 RepID=UPI001C20218E|nr:uncharacterized protein LOC121737216 [Aricia agestis]